MPGWIVAGNIGVGGRTLVVETSWYRHTHVEEHSRGLGTWELDFDDPSLPSFDDGVARQTHESCYFMAMAGLRSEWQRRVSL